MEEDEEPVPSWFGSRLRLLALVLAVPLLGWLVAQIRDPEDALTSIVESVSVGAALGGILLLLFIGAAGAAATRSREMLLALFRPGLYLTALSLMVLVIAHGAIAIVVLVQFVRAPAFIFAMGLGAIAGGFEIISNVFSLVQKAESDVVGVPLPAGAELRLWSRVREVATRLGALEPEHIVVGLDPTFFVTEADVNCVNDGRRLSGRTLYCSLPLMRILDVSEFSSILGHELGHFKGKDTRFSEKFYPIYRGTASALAAITADNDPEESRIPVLPAIAVLGYFMETFSRAERALSRTRELAADAEGALVTDARTAAAALVKIHAFSPLWGVVQEGVANGVRGRSLFLNLSLLYLEETARPTKDALLGGITERHLAHPTDSHPPLHTRLDALGIPLDSVVTEGLRTDVPSPAIGLLDGFLSLERTLSIGYQELMAGLLGINLERLPPQPSDRKSSWNAKKRRERMSPGKRRR